MLSEKTKIIGIFSISFIVWLVSDILTKLWAISPDFQPMSFIDGWFYLTDFQKNDGIALSIDVPRFIQIGGSALILIFLLTLGIKYVLKLKVSKIIPAIMLGAVVAGGVGNLIERISQGYVVDFIVLKHVSVFNIADIGITLGLVGLFVTMLLEESKIKKHERKKTSHL